MMETDRSRINPQDELESESKLNRHTFIRAGVFLLAAIFFRGDTPNKKVLEPSNSVDLEPEVGGNELAPNSGGDLELEGTERKTPTPIPFLLEPEKDT